MIKVYIASENVMLVSLYPTNVDIYKDIKTSDCVLKKFMETEFEHPEDLYPIYFRLDNTPDKNTVTVFNELTARPFKRYEDPFSLLIYDKLERIVYTQNKRVRETEKWVELFKLWHKIYDYSKNRSEQFTGKYRMFYGQIELTWNINTKELIEIIDLHHQHTISKNVNDILEATDIIYIEYYLKNGGD